MASCPQGKAHIARVTKLRRAGRLFCLTGKSVTLVIFCLAPFAKIFRFASDPNHLYINGCPASHRGAFRDRHERRVRDAVDAAASGVEVDRRAGFGS
jgi:hypothetical protein